MTNLERIRAMNDEELARFIQDVCCDTLCDEICVCDCVPPYTSAEVGDNICRERIKAWLKQEVKDNAID